MEALILAFPVVTVTAFVGTTGLLLYAVRSAVPSTSADEHRFRAFRHVRIGTYAALLALQTLLIIARQWEHWPGWSAVDVDGALVWALYVMTLAVLLRRRRDQLGLRLSPVLLLTMVQVGLLLAQDAATSTGSSGGSGGGGSGGAPFDAERIARVSLHGLELVMLLALLVCEVIIQQHQLLTRSSSSDGDYPYWPLGDAEEAAGGGGDAAKRWRPGDGRIKMAAGAFRYVWPSSGMLRMRLLACFFLVMVERGVNLAVPVLFKNMVEALSLVDGLEGQEGAAGALTPQLAPGAGGGGGAAGGSLGSVGGGGAGAVRRALLAALRAGGFSSGGGGGGDSDGGVGGGGVGVGFWGAFYPWAFYYLGTLFLRGGAGGEGLLADVRDILWIPITQAAFRRISLDVFGHLLALDLHWHLHRKTGQVMRILDRGTTSIQDTVSIVLFNVLPSMIDILVACSYLAGKMEPWVALIVLVTVSSYVPLTVCITERRGKVRKVMNALDNEREGRATDVLLNYETVKYFGNEAFELSGYDTATRRYQAAEYWQMVFLSLLSMVQSSVVWVGMAAGLAVCVRGVARGSLTVGDTVLFVTMMQQLYVPLTFFGSYYRQVQKALIDMENMFELLATEPRTKDDPGAPPLKVTEGRVEFRDVVFGYHPTNPVLKGVSFTVPGATTLAVVGSTGSGKSTILRLLLRFYDPQSGAILIDGSNVRRASQSSVRAATAVVPQDTVLFNDTIMYNIRYGRPGATDEQVYEAARIAHIHQHLLAFPAGYATRVGERGLRLSGGEKQRVAFARAVLKGPAVLVLDEATSALDSLTERLIQSSLQAMRGRCTTLLVAHRLSTVMDAEQILVLEKGKVAEVGGHSELMDRGGLYAAMWARQQADGGGGGGGRCSSSPDLAQLQRVADAAQSGGGGGGGQNGMGGGGGNGAGGGPGTLGGGGVSAGAQDRRGRPPQQRGRAPPAGAEGGRGPPGGGSGCRPQGPDADTAPTAREAEGKGAASSPPPAPGGSEGGDGGVGRAYSRASSSIRRYRLRRTETDADESLMTTPALTPRGSLMAFPHLLTTGQYHGGQRDDADEDGSGGYDGGYDGGCDDGGGSAGAGGGATQPAAEPGEPGIGEDSRRAAACRGGSGAASECGSEGSAAEGPVAACGGAPGGRGSVGRGPRGALGRAPAAADGGTAGEESSAGSDSSSDGGGGGKRGGGGACAAPAAAQEA